MAAATQPGEGSACYPRIPRSMALELHSVLFCAFVTWMGWHYPAGPAGRHPSPSRPRAAPGPAGRNRFTPCAVTSTVTAPTARRGDARPLFLAGPPFGP
jgi:hypothetical protein